MANARRGEVDIRLAGKKYVMRPTFDALAAIEDMTGRSLQITGQSVMAGSVRAVEIAAVILCGIRAVDPDTDLTVSDIGTAIMDDGGVAAVRQPVIDFLADLLVFYGDGKKKDPSAAAPATS